MEHQKDEFRQEEILFKDSDAFRPERAAQELKGLVDVYWAIIPPGSQGARLAAKRLIEHVILQQGQYRLEEKDLAPHLEKIKAAAEETAEGYVAEIQAYEQKLAELIQSGRTPAEAENELAADSKGGKKYVDLTKEESLYRLKLMLEGGFLDLNKYPWLKTPIVQEVKKEIKGLLEENNPRGKQKAREATLSYEKLGLLDRKNDADVFSAVGE